MMTLSSIVMMRDCFNEKRKNLKYKKGNRFYTIHGRDYKRKSDPNPHINLIFYVSPMLGDA